MKRALLLLPPENRDRIYGKDGIAAIERMVDLADCCDKIGDLDALKPELAEAQIILSGWGMMALDEEFLAAAPALEAVFYGAGSVRGFVTEAFWERDILLTSAWAANAIPVVEFTLAAIVFGLKRAVQAARTVREQKRFERPQNIPGAYNARVGVIGAGMVGRGVLERLKHYDVQTCCYDPYVSVQRMYELGARSSDLEEIFATCDVVSLHAARTTETQQMVTGKHFGSMKDGAVFINTARGSIVDEEAMIEELRRERIFAFIDVTHPEPPPAESPLYRLPNVFLTPHVAGALGHETRRNGEYAVEELRRYLEGEEPRHPVSRQMMAWMA